MAAAAAGVRTVLIPADNMKDLPELDPAALAVLEIKPCRTLAEVLSMALTHGVPQSVPMPITGGMIRPAEQSLGAQGGSYGS